MGRYLRIVFVALLFIMVGCGEDDTESTTIAESKTSENSVVVGAEGISPNVLNSSEDGLDIVFSGGGAKSIAQIGALKEMEAQDITFRRLVGTSSGSIMATFLAAGYTADEMMAAITERTPDGDIILASFLDVPSGFEQAVVEESLMFAFFEHFLDSFLPLETAEKLDDAALGKLFIKEPFREAFNFIENGGAYSGEEFIVWIRKYLDAGDRNLADATIQQFYEQTGNDLTLIVTDVTEGNMLMVNHNTAPDVPIAWLVRMSTSIPFVYENVIWQPEWGSYLGEDISGHVIVDGGLGSNMGIELVVSQEPEFVAAMGMEPDPDRVVGLFLDNTIPVKGIENHPQIEEEIHPDDTLHLRWTDVQERNQALFDTFLRSHDHFVVRTHPDKVCHLPVGGYDTLEFNMSEERAKLLFASGEEAMGECLLDLK